ncbi:hypothetical protein F5Y12DRAFT_638598 [Xylaria sp. FL1777]|nr:hypothetical protein F5Y12DRAFT_638598 [Xylaria sp. FL1777]
MSYDMDVLWNNTGGLTYDGPMAPTPQPLVESSNFDNGLDTADELNSILDASSTTSQAVVESEGDWPVEFYRLQSAYYRAQLDLSHQAQHRAETQAQHIQATKANLPLQPPLNIDTTCQPALPFDTTILPEWDCSTNPLPRCSNGVSQSVGQVEPSIALPQMVGNESLMDGESPLSRKSGSGASQSHFRKHSPDAVPLYNPEEYNTATAVSQLRNMESRFKAETTRRIAQVEDSQPK